MVKAFLLLLSIMQNTIDCTALFKTRYTYICKIFAYDFLMRYEVLTISVHYVPKSKDSPRHDPLKAVTPHA